MTSHPYRYGTPSHVHFPSPSSLTLIENETTPFPYPPPIQVKHPTWFLHNADLFLSHRETIFGFHQEKFQTTYFSTILNTIEPGRTAAQGTVFTLPIPCNDIPRTTIIAFAYLLYYPGIFTTTRDGWQAIRALALRWCFTRIMVRALYELRHFDRRRFSFHQRQLLSINAAYLVNSLQLRRWEDRYVRPALAEDDEEN
jgi:hypothetical protein